MAKQKDLIDSFMTDLFQEAKEAVDSVTEKPASNAKRPIDLVTQRPSDPPTNLETNPWTNLETQRPSDPVTDLVTQRPRDPVTDLVTQRPSDPVTDNQTNLSSQNNRASDLTEKQYKVLKFIYFNRPFKVYSDKGLGAIDNMGPNNAKNQIRSLNKKGYIYKPYSVNDGVNKGSTCRVVEDKCMPLFGPTNIVNPPSKKAGETDLVTQRPSDPVTDLVTQRPSDPVTDLVASSYSSSSYLNKTTTKKKFLTENEIALSEIMASDPEYKFWIDENVSPTQVAKWLFEFGTDLQTMLNNMCYIRWQIINQDTKIEKSAAAYIYKIMAKNGGTVNKPAGYKSLKQLNVEALEKWRDEQKDYIAKQERIKQEVTKTEYGPEADKILSKPSLENEYFQAALNSVTSDQRRRKIELTIQSGKQLDESQKNVLRGHLITELSKKEFA